MTTNNTNNDFLPPDYETPEEGGNYLNKFKDGENKIRILSSPLIAWLYWGTDGKPHRLAQNAKEKPAVDQSLIREDKNSSGRKSVKHFWALKVYDYSDKKMKVMEITQYGIKSGIENLFKKAEWGDPKKYDIIITKKGSGLDTEYQVTPCPAAPVTEEMKKSYLDTPINLQALMIGGDPFAKPIQQPVAQTNTTQPVAEVKQEIKEEPKPEVKKSGDDDLPF